ncbi:MAG: DUF2785 domain-containing protein [Chloroflexota bacterium]
MDKAFWQAIVDSDYKVPEGQSVRELTPELLTFLGSTDMTVRDPFGYTILTLWIVRDRQYTPEDLRAFRDAWVANLEKGIGENGTDSVFLRSFSVLMLSILVYRDNQESFFTRDEIKALVDKVLWYFAAEQDLRGYTSDKGWAHSAAHTADALKFLARNPLSEADDHQRMLDAMVDKLILPVTSIYMHGEDERLVSVVIDILKRETISTDAWNTWIERFQTWKTSRPEPEGDDFKPATHAPWLNSKNFLRSLYFRLETTPDLPAASYGLKSTLIEVLKVFGQ